MVKTYSSKKSAIVTGRPRRKQTTSAAAKGARAAQPQSSSDSPPSRLPISQDLLNLTEEEGREIAMTFADDLTSEGVLAAFSDKLRSEILRRSPRDAKGNIIKTRECGRPEDLKHLTFNEIRHLPLKRCLLCGYIGSRGNTTARHSATHGDHDNTLIDVPWQVCLVKDAVPSGSMEEFRRLLSDHSGHTPMRRFKQAGSPAASSPCPGSATCLISATGKCPSVPTGRATPAASATPSLESSPAPAVWAPPPLDWTPALRSPSPLFTAIPELQIPLPTYPNDMVIDPLLLGPFGHPDFSQATYYPAMNDYFMNASQEINMAINQNMHFAAFEPYALDDDNQGMREKRAWDHLQHGGEVDYTPLITVY